MDGFWCSWFVYYYILFLIIILHSELTWFTSPSFEHIWEEKNYFNPSLGFLLHIRIWDWGKGVYPFPPWKTQFSHMVCWNLHQWCPLTKKSQLMMSSLLSHELCVFSRHFCWRQQNLKNDTISQLLLSGEVTSKNVDTTSRSYDMVWSFFYL